MHMLRFSLLGSGSSGNAILVTSPAGKILIDCGLSLRKIQLRASELGESLDGLQAVFLTHEHSDHLLGLGPLARKLGTPVFMTNGAFNGLPPTVGKLPEVHCFDAGEAIEISDMRVQSFSVSHDAADPVSYTVECGGAKMGLAADLGHPTALVRTRLAGSHALVLESNHCPDMLRRGKYPPALQQRIRSRVGHLSNGDMSTLLSELLHERLQVVVLVHISEENNDHDLAVSMAARVLEGRNVSLCAAYQDRPTPLFEVRP